MLKLYYSGAKVPNQAQTRPEKSLGGYVSNSAVVNGRTNNLFSDASVVGLYNNQPEIIGLFIKNEGPLAVENLYIGIQLAPDSGTLIELAVVGVDAEKPALEVLESADALPSVGEFHTVIITDPELDAENNGSAFLTALLPVGGWLGLWVRRTLGSASAMPDTNQMLIDFKANNYANVLTPALPEKLEIVFEYEETPLG